jgi:hypothetical protein
MEILAIVCSAAGHKKLKAAVPCSLLAAAFLKIMYVDF